MTYPRRGATPISAVSKAKSKVWAEHPQLDVALKELIDSGLSYGAITIRMRELFPNQTFTRSSLIGRAHRQQYYTTNKPGGGVGRGNNRPRAFTLGTNKKVKVDKNLAPVVFKEVKANEQGLRSDDETRIPRARLLRHRKHVSVTPEELARRRMGSVPSIIEESPLTSKPFFETAHDECKWPTSDDASDLSVCGAPACIGAYCERHGRVAYREMPTVSRNGTMRGNKHSARLGYHKEEIEEAEERLPELPAPDRKIVNPLGAKLILKRAL